MANINRLRLMAAQVSAARSKRSTWVGSSGSARRWMWERGSSCLPAFISSNRRVNPWSRAVFSEDFAAQGTHVCRENVNFLFQRTVLFCQVRIAFHPFQPDTHLLQFNRLYPGSVSPTPVDGVRFSYSCQRASISIAEAAGPCRDRRNQAGHTTNRAANRPGCTWDQPERSPRRSGHGRTAPTDLDIDSPTAWIRLSGRATRFEVHPGRCEDHHRGRNPQMGCGRHLQPADQAFQSKICSKP